VSTLYLVAALRDNLASQSATHNTSMKDALPPCVYGTEHEDGKAKIAYKHIHQAFSENKEADEIEKNGQVQILQGDLLVEIPKQKFRDSSLDALLVDIWAPVALPTLKLLEPALRPGALLFIDNTISSRDRYSELLSYIDEEKNGWQSQVMPYKGGFEVAVKRSTSPL
jgi:predicted O-methyltransferase YrrM